MLDSLSWSAVKVNMVPLSVEFTKANSDPIDKPRPDSRMPLVTCVAADMEELPEFAEGRFFSVLIPVGCVHLRPGAFSDVDCITEVSIPDGVTHIGADCFRNCTGLVSVEIPFSVRHIDDAAFENCRNLASIKLPSGVSLGLFAFAKCDGLQTLTLPARARTKSSFKNCARLETVVVWEGVEVIGADCFCGCRNLKSVALPDSLRRIGDWAFFECSQLGSIRIPPRVLRIPRQCFAR